LNVTLTGNPYTLLLLKYWGLVGIAESAIKSLEMLDMLWDKASIQGQRYLVGMLYPEKLTFEGGVHRTTKMNEAAEIIYLKNKELRAKKMTQKYKNRLYIYIKAVLGK
jgi:hypothetical protein